MQLHHCPDCGLTQLGYIVNPKVVYQHFPFVSGTTRTATLHLQALAQRLVEVTPLAKDSFAVDIGSNDGTLLKGYVPYGVRFLGVDPRRRPRPDRERAAASRRSMGSSTKNPPRRSAPSTGRPMPFRQPASSATSPTSAA